MPRHAWKKGEKSPNPKGRPPVLLPEVQGLIDQHRNMVRVAILDEFAQKDPSGYTALQKAIREVIDNIIVHGDAQKLKIMLEMSLGKLDEINHLDLSADERAIVLEYRRRIKESQSDKLSGGEGQ